MVIEMNEAKLTTLEQLRQFLAGTAAVVFKPGADDTRYAHIAEVLRRFQYAGLKRPEKGLVLRYLERTTGYSRQQLTRLVARFQALRQIEKRYRSPEVASPGSIPKPMSLCWPRRTPCTAPCPARRPVS